MKKIYLIYCSTGCSCCCSENHYRGPYKTKEDAQKRIDYFFNGKWYPLASQYASRGKYRIEEYNFEKISKNRVIIGDKVFSEIKFIELNKNGSLSPVDADFFDY